MDDNLYSQIRRLGLLRDPDRWLGGVMGAFAHKFNQDRALLRGLALASLIVSGAAAVVYATAWMLLPDRQNGKSLLERLTKGDFDPMVLGAAGIAILGMARGDFLLGFNGGPISSSIFAFCLLSIIAVFTIGLVQSSSQKGGPAAGSTSPSEPLWSNNVTHESSSASAAHPTFPDGVSPSHPTPPVAAAATAGSAPYRHPLPQPQSQWQEPWQPRQPVQPKVVVPKAGFRAFGVAVGLLMIAYAVAIVVTGSAVIDHRLALIILGATLTFTGAAIVVGAFRGWSSGSLSTFAVLVAILAFFSGSAMGVNSFFSSLSNGGLIADSSTWDPEAQGFDKGTAYLVGDLTVDLSDLAAADDDKSASVNMLAGEIYILVPEDINVQLNYWIGAGDINVDVAEVDPYKSGGVFGSGDILLAAGEEDGPLITLNVQLGAGEVTVRNN